MFHKLLGKSEKKASNNTKQLEEYLSKIGISEIRSLLLGQVEKFPVDEEMLIVVLKKITYEDVKMGQRFLQSSDNDIKLKKTFDTLITAANSKKVTIEAIELIQKFINMYKELIESYDQRNKQIYMHKLTKALESSLEIVVQMTAFINKLAVIHQ